MSASCSEPPPHPGEDRSTKKAKRDADSLMLLESQVLPTPTANASSANASPDSVPETPATMQVDPEEPAIPSFKDKLMGHGLCQEHDEEDEDELIIRSSDVTLGMNGTVPTIDFAAHILETLNKRMGFAVVIKLLGCSVGYHQMKLQLQKIWKPRGPFQLTDLEEDCYLVKFKDDIDYQDALINGPWVIFGHYLSVKPWYPDFNPRLHKINEILAWIRLPQLPARYYHKNVIRSIGSMFGEVIKVDYNTESGNRGKFARLAILLDLTQPLTSKIQVDGQTFYVEYEGLPTICFLCGKYGHLQEYCPSKNTTPTTQLNSRGGL